MNKLILLTGLLTCFVQALTWSQHTYLPLGSEEYHLLSRLETRSGWLSNQLFLNAQPVPRKDAVDFLLEEKANFYNSGLTNIDYHNINRALSISSEYMPNALGASDAARPVLRTFYKNEADFYSFSKNGFYLSLNPVLGIEGIYDKNSSRTLKFNSAQGAEIRGTFKNRLGFYFYFTNNYEEPVDYATRRFDRWHAVPSAGSFRRTAHGFQYFQFRGYANIGLIKDHIHLTLGYGNQFLGDGYRSLFLSDFSEGAFFAQISTKVWKLNYQNLYTILKPQSLPGEPLTPGKKFATTHFLSLNVTRWLNIGLFETVTFTRDKNYEFAYLNPIIFYRAIERSMGSPDKQSIGFSGKAIELKHINMYTQLLINEFTEKELLAGDGYWANKWGIQLGAKYFDAFSVPNLDIQAEINMVRPYTYQHYESVAGNAMANYTHFNQPLAHPLGAGFAELIAIARYQPIPRLSIQAQGMYYKQGVDTGNMNYGSDILKSYVSRSANYGIGITNGPEVSCLLLDLTAAYEIRPRLFFDLGVTQRTYSWAGDVYPQEQSLYVHSGLRLNLRRKNYNQY